MTDELLTVLIYRSIAGVWRIVEAQAGKPATEQEFPTEEQARAYAERQGWVVEEY